MNVRRIRYVNTLPIGSGPVAYWMNRDQRLRDNWALIFAAEEAKKRKVPLAIIFCVAPHFLETAKRQCAFMLEGLLELEQAARAKHIPFLCLIGEPTEEIPAFVERHHVGQLVTDFSPLRLERRCRESLAKTISVSCVEVDAHNIVPCWLASDHQEFAARTIRPKIHRLLPEFLEEFPRALPRVYPWTKTLPQVSRRKMMERLSELRSGMSLNFSKTAGERASHRVLREFLEKRLFSYDVDRNNPTLDGQSGLSPYLRFGQLSAQRVALAVKNSSVSRMAKEAFLEELIIRRELADNYCLYNSQYDSVKGFPAWAQKTMDMHRRDKRPFAYTRRQFELGKTHDQLWNACQLEMVKTGKMHGYMRMYWAKKILEWTKTPEDAMRIAISLNDTYELDGNDPNGYAGIAWAIGGVHDRPWFARSVFGTIRYMSQGGARSKFDVDAYIARWVH